MTSDASARAGDGASGPHADHVPAVVAYLRGGPPAPMLAELGAARLTVRRLAVPMRAPLVAAHGTVARRELVLVELDDGEGRGWGECAALPTRSYDGVAADDAYRVLCNTGPAVIGGALASDPVRFGTPDLLSRMTWATVEMAVVDLLLRRIGVPLAAAIGATRARVPARAALGRSAEHDAHAMAVERLVAMGYRRVKLKIEPGWDVAPARAALAALPAPTVHEPNVHVDANGSFASDRADHLDLLRAVVAAGVGLIEQPFPAADLAGLRRLTAALDVPVAIDETASDTASALAALGTGAGDTVCVKPGRLGGLREARALVDTCARHRWQASAGGMLECGVGKAALVAIAALPGCTLAGDISASDRWFPDDVATPFVLVDGDVAVPNSAGLGVEVDIEAVDRFTVDSATRSLTTGSIRAGR